MVTPKYRVLLSGGAALGSLGSYVAFGGGATDANVVWAYRKFVPVPYEGERNTEGKKHGFGEQCDELTGVYYKGQYENGKLSGVGTLIQRNGETYKGGFQNNLRHGRGTLSLTDAQKNGFEATLNFSSGLIDEQNADGVVIKRTYGNGVWLFEGPFKFNPQNASFPFLFSGRVKITYTNSFDEDQNYLFFGDIVENRKVKGKLTSKNKPTYDGRFVDEISCDDSGRMTYANGDVYTGGVLDLRRQGQGTTIRRGWLWSIAESGRYMDDRLVDLKAGAPFCASERYAGPLTGYVFTRGPQGQGYYIDKMAQLTR